MTPGSGHEPPNWIPRALLAVLPGMVGGMAVGGRFGPRWALGCLLVGVLLLLLLIGWWSAPASLAGFMAVAGVSVVCAVLVTGAFVWFGRLVTESPITPLARTGTPRLPSRPDLSNARLDGDNLDGAHLDGAVLDDVSAVKATMIGAHLAGASFRRAVLTDAVMTGACLRNADFRGASLAGTVFVGADLRGAQLDTAEKVDLPSSANQERSRACS